MILPVADPDAIDVSAAEVVDRLVRRDGSSRSGVLCFLLVLPGLLLLFAGLPELLGQGSGKGLSGVFESGNQGPELADGVGVVRVGNLVGPFTGVPGGVVGKGSVQDSENLMDESVDSQVLGLTPSK